MINFIKKSYKGIVGALALAFTFGVTASTHAADTDFSAAVASTTQNQNDTVPIILQYMTTTGGKVLIIVVLSALISLGIAMIAGAVFKRKKKR